MIANNSSERSCLDLTGGGGEGGYVGGQQPLEPLACFFVYFLYLSHVPVVGVTRYLKGASSSPSGRFFSRFCLFLFVSVWFGSYSLLKGSSSRSSVCSNQLVTFHQRAAARRRAGGRTMVDESKSTQQRVIAAARRWYTRYYGFLRTHVYR